MHHATDDRKFFHVPLQQVGTLGTTESLNMDQERGSPFRSFPEADDRPLSGRSIGRFDSGRHGSCGINNDFNARQVSRQPSGDDE